MNKTTTALLLALLLGLNEWATAQNTVKIAHVNIQELVKQHPKTAEAHEILEQEKADMQEVYDQMLAEHEAAISKFEKESATYSDFVKETKQKEILDQSQKIQVYSENAQTTIKKRNMELLEPIYKEINQLIARTANEKGITYVLDTGSGAVAYVAPSSIDLTPVILKIIQEKE